ncbi:lytic murein transglycosylase, partial [Acinetobacter nosocomialis]
MRRFSCIVGSVFLAMTQAQAELVINGSTISSNATVPVTNSDTYTPNNNFQSCLANLRSQAIAAGVSGSTYDRYTQNLTPDYSVIDKLNYQPEFSTPIWDY